MNKDSLYNYNVAFIAEVEADFRSTYGILDLTSRDCEYLFRCDTEEERRAYLRKNYPQYFLK